MSAAISTDLRCQLTKVDREARRVGAPEFDGNRWNDLHYKNTIKRAARERATEEDE